MSLFYLKFMSLLGIYRIENGIKKERIVQGKIIKYRI